MEQMVVGNAGFECPVLGIRLTVASWPGSFGDQALAAAPRFLGLARFARIGPHGDRLARLGASLARVVQPGIE